jgi:hypothetical protein
MGAVFVSYRRGDTEGQARALFNELADLIGRDSVFMDVDSIALGRDFRQILQERLGSCDLMLALIGSDWLDIKDASGKRRLENPADFVRQEIAAALRRNIPVTPVLVQGTQMPAPEQLPDDLKDLAYRNAFELSHTRWESDVAEMIKRLGLRKADARESRPTATVTGGADRPVVTGSGGAVVAGGAFSRKTIAIGVGAILLAVVLVALLSSGGDSDDTDSSTSLPSNEPSADTVPPSSPSPGSTGSLDVTADEAVSGSQTLDPGFEPDPVTVSVQAGGDVDLSTLSLGSECVGWAVARPDVIVNFTGSGTRLRFYASSSSDTALAVLDPNDGWHCNDDTDGNNPDVTVAPSVPGTYRVWVTSYSEATAGATLGITEAARSR